MLSGSGVGGRLRAVAVDALGGHDRGLAARAADRHLGVVRAERAVVRGLGRGLRGHRGLKSALQLSWMLQNISFGISFHKQIVFVRGQMTQNEPNPCVIEIKANANRSSNEQEKQGGGMTHGRRPQRASEKAFMVGSRGLDPIEFQS